MQNLMLHVPLSMIALFYKQWDWYLHNIRIISSIKHSSLYFFYTEKLTDRIFSHFFNQTQLKLMDWSFVYGQHFHKLSWKSVQYFLRYPCDGYTDKRTYADKRRYGDTDKRTYGRTDVRTYGCTDVRISWLR